jgi:two-component system CheB/CheR fusion protein
MASAFPIVGVGASAGGLEAFSQLLAALPPSLGMAIIFVQHLAPKRDSMLPELLGHATSMPVVQIVEGVVIEPDHVYVTPPNVQVDLVAGQLHLSPRPSDSSQYTPVDHFFRSLAEGAQSRAIAVVLSGTAADGASGLREIKAVGGIALAQEPGTAKFDGMPRAAVATGVVDLVLPPKELAQELVRIGRHPFIRHVEPRRDGDELVTFNDRLPRIFLMLRGATGVDFTHYKQPTIRRRLGRRMVLHKLTSIDQYVTYLQKNPEELQALYGDLLIHVTRFFREPEAFKAMSEVVFPAIVANRGRDDPIRIWVPGCATGEEPYSIGMALLEFLGDRAGATPVQIFATDVSETAIEHARAGVYPEGIAADVSPERLRRFFNHTDGNYRITKTVRDLCIFARQYLTRDPPFSRMDLIVCRNVLIYLGAVLQKRLMGVFHYALKPTGHLMLGAAETIGASTDLFVVSDKRHRLYGKRVGSVRADMNFPSMEQHARSESGEGVAVPSRHAPSIQNEANRVILDRYSPPAVLVDSDLQIVHFRGQTGPYLEPAPGEASLSVLKMAREGLLHGLRTALAEVRRGGGTVRREGMRVKDNGGTREVNLEVIAVEGSAEGRHFLVLFEGASKEGRAAAPKRARSVRGARRAAAEESRVLQLEQELAASREYLQSIIQDLEAANEELQSANEEILSSNEELQSTNEELDTAKEELQSTNEELNTVNEELHNRNEELSRVNSDMINLLGSVQIAIVMVARDLRIRRFTPMAERVMNLIPTDVGRRISDIKPNIECPDLEKLIVEAMERVTTLEREVHDRQGAGYSLRIRPYKSLDHRIDGAILVLFEVDAGRRQELADAAGAPGDGKSGGEPSKPSGDERLKDATDAA